MNHIQLQNALLLLWHLEHCLPSRLADGTCIMAWLTSLDIGLETLKKNHNLSQLSLKSLRFQGLQVLNDADLFVGSKTDLFICQYFCYCSRRLLRKSRRLGRRNFQHGKHARFNKRHHFQERLSKHQKHGLDYYEKKALEFSKYQDKINILKNKHGMVHKRRNPVC